MADIYEYVGTRNPSAAERLIDEFEAMFAHVAEFPRAIRERRVMAKSLRMAIVGVYLILYRIVPGGVEIVRVVHGARDLRQIEMEG